MIKEEFLHYVWQSLQFDLHDLKTTHGKKIVLAQRGLLNPNSGPDFTGARIYLDDMLWVGNVEIHLNSSDWYKHAHHEDESYDNVILHVVLKEDQKVLDRYGKRIPCLELFKRINKKLLKRYRKLNSISASIPCSNSLAGIPELIRISSIERGFASGMEKKGQRVRKILDESRNNWELAFHFLLFRNFGLYVNADAFEDLFKSVPYEVYQKERNDLLSLEALLFGQAAFLPEKSNKDAYVEKLSYLYAHQQLKYGLKPISHRSWKFLRMRPQNFPTLRIAQLAALLRQKASFVEALKSINDLAGIEAFFDTNASDYWKNHYRFNKITDKGSPKLSKPFIHLIYINTIVPFFFILGQARDDPKTIEEKVNILEDITPENNKIIRLWKENSLSVPNAYISQGLLGLYREFCSQKSCLRCPNGHYLLKGK